MSSMDEFIASAIEAEVRRQVDALLKEPKRPKLLTRSEAAELLRVSVRQIDLLREKGLPTRWAGDSPRFLETEILEWTKEERE